MANSPYIDQPEKLHLSPILQAAVLETLEILFQSYDLLADGRNQEGFIPSYLNDSQAGHSVGFPR